MRNKDGRHALSHKGKFSRGGDTAECTPSDQVKFPEPEEPRSGVSKAEGYADAADASRRQLFSAHLAQQRDGRAASSA